MPRASRAFENTHEPSHLRAVPNLGRDDPPYERIKNGELPPMMFQVRLSDGQRYCFSYSDIRQIYRRDAGCVHIDLQALARTTIVLSGRNLDEVVNLLSTGVVKWVRERDPRAAAAAEDSVEINSINVTLEAK